MACHSLKKITLLKPQKLSSNKYEYIRVNSLRKQHDARNIFKWASFWKSFHEDAGNGPTQSSEKQYGVLQLS